MTATAKRDKFKQFAAAHALRGDAVSVRIKPTDSGLLVSVSCSCGASTVDTLTRQECAEVLTHRALEREEPLKKKPALLANHLPAATQRPDTKASAAGLGLPLSN